MKKRHIALIMSLIMATLTPVGAMASPVCEDASVETSEDDSTESLVYETDETETLTEEEGNDLINVCGFKGMSLTSEGYADKQALEEVTDDLADMKPGEDYVDGEVLILAETREQAQAMADCYNAVLESYSYGVGVISIEDISCPDEITADDDTASGKETQTVLNVKSLVELSGDTSNSLPAVYPNIKYKPEKSRSVQIDNDGVETAGTASEKYTGDLYQYQWANKFIGADRLYESGITGKGVKVAVLDTGTDVDHEDIKANVVTNDWLNATSDEGDSPKSLANDEHGTHTAGCIAADDNGVGVTGIAPDAQIVPIKVFDKDENGDTENIVRGINFAIKDDVDIISMSLGSEFSDPAEHKVIKKAAKAGCIVVVSAGNESGDFKEYPASFEETISVAALAPSWEDDDLAYGLSSAVSVLIEASGNSPTVGKVVSYNEIEDDLLKQFNTDNPGQEAYNAAKAKAIVDFVSDNPNIKNLDEAMKEFSGKTLDEYDACLAEYSQWGDTVDIASPGSVIASTIPNNGYVYMDGTSMACPIVSGAVALLLQANSDIKDRYPGRYEDVRHILQNGAYTKNGGFTSEVDEDLTNISFKYEGEEVEESLGIYKTSGNVEYALNIYNAVNGGSVVSLEAPAAESDISSKNIAAGDSCYLKLKNPNSIGDIYYTIDEKFDADIAEKYESSGIPLDFTGKHTIYAAVVYRGMMSKALKITKNFVAEAVSVNALDVAVVPGKSADIVLDATPSYAAISDIDWDEGEEYIIKGKKGKYTITPDVTFKHPEGVKVTGKYTTSAGTQIPVSFTLKSIDAATTRLTVSENNVSISYVDKNVLKKRGYTDEDADALITDLGSRIPVKTMSLSGLVTSDAKGTTFTYKSSKPAVASVDNYGNVTVKKTGKAVITVMANDGSKKKAKIKVASVIPAYMMTVETSTGFNGDYYDSLCNVEGSVSANAPICPGGKIKLYASFNNSESAGKLYLKPTNSKLVFTVSSDSADKVKLSKSGMLKCLDSAKAGDVINVEVTSADGCAPAEQLTFRVFNRADDIELIGSRDTYPSDTEALTIEQLALGTDDNGNDVGLDSVIKITGSGYYPGVSYTLAKNKIINSYTMNVDDQRYVIQGYGKVKIDIAIPDGSGMKVTRKVVADSGE